MDNYREDPLEIILQNSSVYDLVQLQKSIDRRVNEAIQNAFPAAFQLSKETNMSPETIVRKAMGLFKIAVDAEAEGNRLAILSPEDDIIQDIVGISDHEKASAPIMSK